MEDGEIDYRPFLSELRKGGFEGPVVYEMCSPLEGGTRCREPRREGKGLP